MQPIRSGESNGTPSLPGRHLVLEAGDLVTRIPSRCLRPGARDLKRPIRIPFEEVLPGLERGRVVVSLGRLAALCPEIFGDGVHGNHDLPVELPLARIVQQIPEFRSDSPREVGGEPLIEELRAGDGLIADETTVSEGVEMIRLNLSSVLRGARGKILDSPVDASTTVSLPLHRVEEQLASGRVAFKASELAAGVPPELRPAFEAAGDLEIDIPLDEVFRNLPGGDLSEPVEPARSKVEPASAPGAVEPKKEEPVTVASGPGSKPPEANVTQSPQALPVAAPQGDVLSATGGPDVFGRRILAGGPAIMLAAQHSTREGGGDAVDQIMNGFPEIEQIDGCAVVLARDLRLAGEIPEAFDPRAFRDQAWDLLEEIARRGELFGLAAPVSFTWRTRSGNVTMMARGEVCACAFHGVEDLGEKGRVTMMTLLDRLNAEL